MELEETPVDCGIEDLPGDGTPTEEVQALEPGAGVQAIEDEDMNVPESSASEDEGSDSDLEKEERTLEIAEALEVEVPDSVNLYEHITYFTIHRVDKDLPTKFRCHREVGENYRPVRKGGLQGWKKRCKDCHARLDACDIY